MTPDSIAALSALGVIITTLLRLMNIVYEFRNQRYLISFILLLEVLVVSIGVAWFMTPLITDQQGIFGIVVDTRESWVIKLLGVFSWLYVLEQLFRSRDRRSKKVKHGRFI